MLFFSPDTFHLVLYQEHLSRSLVLETSTKSAKGMMLLSPLNSTTVGVCRHSIPSKVSDLLSHVSVSYWKFGWFLVFQMINTYALLLVTAIVITLVS